MYACKCVLMYGYVITKQARLRIWEMKHSLFPEEPKACPSTGDHCRDRCCSDGKSWCHVWLQTSQYFITWAPVLLCPPNRWLHNPLSMCHCPTKCPSWGRGAKYHWLTEADMEKATKATGISLWTEAEEEKDQANITDKYLRVWVRMFPKTEPNTHCKGLHCQLRPV